MARRLVSLLLVLFLLGSMAGCASMLDKEYISVTGYVEPAAASPTDEGQMVKNYDEMRGKILSLVNEHAESGKIDITSYDGDVGDMLRDLDAACVQVREDTPIGAYAVEYISRADEPVQIVSYYEVGIHIEYKRTLEQVEAIKPMASAAQLQEALEELLNAGGDRLTVQMTTSILGEAQIKAYLRRAFFDNPLAAPALPALTAAAYPASGLSKIFEITLDYGADPTERTQELDGMRAAVSSLLASSSAETLGGADAVYALFSSLADSCVYSPDAGGAPSAYGALCGDSADSCGMALAFLALNQAIQVPCRVVEGTLDGRAHAWNVVELGGQYYHVDVSAAGETGDAAFLRGDEAMRPRYAWSAADVPACPGDYAAGAGSETGAIA